MDKNPITQAFFLAVKRLVFEKFTYQASALAFTTLISIVPFFAVVVWLTSIMPIFSRLVAIAENIIEQNFLPAAVSSVKTYFYTFVIQASKLPWWSILFLIFTALLLIITIVQSVNSVWQGERQKQPFIHWVLYWLVLMISPLFFLIILLLGGYVFSLFLVMNKGQFLYVYSQPLVLLLNTTLLSIVYITVPKAKVKWRDGILGGVIAAILFEIVRRGFSLYVQAFSSYQLIYGIFSTIPIFLIWLYASWLIFLFGALVVHERALLRREA